ncbi:hypothetical protein PBCVFr5L_772L [Paramecium bursaria Chlorella virus Fr5L]|jgi:hypothetical protein|nr:hypothetical protein PBCVCZ2_771L [Paramecium bursaria Chlorella virus CZ-2]AGE53319.1 hypothetical protein PBCVFr5L_772L [Paramecium bursaria Chlorella virus Fr5L]AGE59219.1 hypothetical protein PBCVOR070422_772L [Paramecium bursaria Chlorella virus OR0704.2.2]
MNTLDKIQEKLHAYIPYIRKLEDKVVTLVDENRNLKNELKSYQKKMLTIDKSVDMR